MVTGGMPDATMTRACRELRMRVLMSLEHGQFREMVGGLSSAGPAPRSPEAALHRSGSSGSSETAGAWRGPGRYGYTRNRHDGQVSRPAAWIECSSSITGHSAGRDGRCVWCERQVEPPVARPELGPDYRTDLGDAYRYHYEPDWGSDPYDV